MREQVRKVVLQQLGEQADLDGNGTRPLHDYSGTVLYSRWTTLQQGQVYVMGLNPGGCPAETPTSVWKSLEGNKCEYKEDWTEGKVPGRAGKHPLQIAVKDLVRTLLGADRECDVFGTIEFCVSNRTLIAMEPTADPTTARTSGACLRNDGHGECWRVG